MYFVVDKSRHTVGWARSVRGAALACVLVEGQIGLAGCSDTSCSPFADGGLKAGQTYIGSLLADATVDDVATYDCDSGGPAFVPFRDRRPPGQTRTDFVKAGCKEIDDDSGDQALTCAGKSRTYTISLEPDGQDGTRGELKLA